MMRNERRIVISVIAGAILAGVLAHAEPVKPLFAEVALTPIAINVTNLKDAPIRSDQASVVNKLQSEATKRTEADLIKDGIAGRVLRMSAGSIPPAGMPVVSGSVSLPVSVGAKDQGMNANFRYDWFAAADLTIKSDRGEVLTRRHEPVRWNDVSWCRHSSSRRGTWHLANRSLDDVLMDTIDGSVDRAVSRAAEQTKSPVR